MDKIRLGRTELYVSKTAFGALPIQRISHADAVKLVRRAYESGINYFDTANAYTDSEEKLGAALHDLLRDHGYEAVLIDESLRKSMGFLGVKTIWTSGLG